MEEVIEEMASKGFKIFLFGGGKREIEILNTLENIHDSIVNLAGNSPLKKN